MAKPDISVVYADAEGAIFRRKGMGFGTIAAPRTIQRLILKRTGSMIKKNSPLDLLNPDHGWRRLGANIEVEDVQDLLANIKIYRNGQLLAQDFDFYFVEKNKIAFVFSIRTSEVLQISKNFED